MISWVVAQNPLHLALNIKYISLIEKNALAKNLHHIAKGESLAVCPLTKTGQVTFNLASPLQMGLNALLGRINTSHDHDDRINRHDCLNFKTEIQSKHTLITKWMPSKDEFQYYIILNCISRQLQ